MFKYRLISFPLLLALLAVIGLWSKGAYLYLVLSPLVVGAAVLEAGILLEKCSFPNFSKVAAVLSGLVTLLFGCCCLFLDNSQWFVLIYLFFAILLIVPVLLFSVLLTKDCKTQLLKSAGTLGVLLLIGLPLFFAASVLFMTDARIFLAFILITKAMDTGGYIVGMLTSKLPGGNHKIVPSISPKKSWEGTIGGIILAMIAAQLINCWSGLNWELLPLAVLSLVMALGSFAGDLTESAIKRSAGVKDSGSLIPGMGGVFDVADSFLYNGLLVAIVMIME